MKLRIGSYATLLFALLIGQHSLAVARGDWSIPLAGNAYRTAPAADGAGLKRNGMIAWSDADGIFSVYFHADRAATIKMAMDARVPDGSSSLLFRVGKQSATVNLHGAEMGRHDIGSFAIETPGYVCLEIQGTQRTGADYAEIRDLIVSSNDKELKLDFVKTNEGNMFYWGRRGPSVHLGYVYPQDVKLQYAYSEITVPKGQDPIGSYFMANGFREGYFGIQVNGPKERRVLFSVWSPFKTDNPREIPEDQRIVTLGKGPEVHVGQFGNEGSGGQSYLVFPWESGKTYRFLTEVKPDAQDNTAYTSWFGDASTGQWRLIASFRRPKTNTHLKGFHSFLESFNPSLGHVGRRANYGNIWVRDVDGQWHACTSAKFSVDPTGGGRHRLDFAGGSDGELFFLRNCGFFSETGRPGETFTRTPNSNAAPAIDFESLPRA